MKFCLGEYAFAGNTYEIYDKVMLIMSILSFLGRE